MSYCGSCGNWDRAELQHQLRALDGGTLGSATVTNWAQYFRDLCTEYFVQNAVQIGGANVAKFDEVTIRPVIKLKQSLFIDIPDSKKVSPWAHSR